MSLSIMLMQLTKLVEKNTSAMAEKKKGVDRNMGYNISGRKGES